MGYTSYGYGQLVWNSIQLEDGALVLNDGNTKPFVQTVGGVYRAVLPTYTAGDAAVMHFTADGKLMVDTELTLDGNVIIDNIAVWATNIADSSTAGFALVDASGHPQVDVMTLPGGLTAYAEDAQHTSGEFGVMALAVRNDSGSSLVGTDGDYAPLMVNAYGMLNINYDMIRDVAPDVNAGAVSAGTPRMILASDDPAVTSLAIVDDWDAVEDSAIGTDGAIVMNKARSSQQAAVAENDAVIPVTNLYGEVINAGFDYSGSFNRMSEVDPVSSHHVSETLADVTNGADGTYYYYFDMDGYKFWATQATLNGGSGTCTVTIEATIQDDSTAPASCTYIDVTNDLFGVASITASNILAADTPQAYKYVRVKVVAATAAADDADWTLYNKKMY